MTLLAYLGHGGGHGASHLLTYILHYFIARILFDAFRSMGFNEYGVGLVAVLMLFGWWVWRAHRRRRWRRQGEAYAYGAARGFRSTWGRRP